jgi:hypothetical protein
MQSMRPSYLESTVAQGQAGVYQVASQLILRGFTPYFPAFDDHGVDILLKEGIRIQVKCTHFAKRSMYPKGAYYFKLQKGPIVTGNRTIKVRPPTIYSTQCDFLILWGIEDNKYWIVPAYILDGVTSVVLGIDMQHKDLNMDVIHEMDKNGFTQKQIANKLGVQQMTISRRLRGQYIKAKRTNSSQVRACEGAWHLIKN